MSGIKEKISASIDKLTHHGNKGGNTGTTGGMGNTGTTGGMGNTGGMGQSSYNQTSTGTGTGMGAGGMGATTGTGMGSGMGTGMGAGTGSATQYNSATNVGAPGVSGYDNTTPTGIDSAGYNTVSGTGTGMGATTTTTGVGATSGVIDQREIIDSKTFTKTVDHEVLVEKKQYELEHRPVQEQYVVETRKIGEARVPGAATELVGNEVREVDERIKAAPRGDRTVVVQDVDVPISEVREIEQGITGQGMTGTGMGGAGTTGTGMGGGMTDTGMGGGMTGTGAGMGNKGGYNTTSATGREI